MTATREKLGHCPYTFCRKCGSPRDNFGSLDQLPEPRNPCCGSSAERDYWTEFEAYDMQANLYRR